MHHVLDVAAVAFAVLETIPEPAKQRLTHALSLHKFEQAARWLSAVIGLHDLGKAVPGFQAKWLEGSKRVEAAGFDFPIGAPDRHDAATLPLLREALMKRSIDRRTAGFLASVVAAHHGFPIPATEADPFIPANFGYSEAWLNAHRFVTGYVFDGVNVQGTPKCDSSLGLTWEWLAGLCAFCDWTASSEVYFPHGRQLDSPLETFCYSLGLARKALKAIGWSGSRIQVTSRVPEPVRLALHDGVLPRPLQSAVSRLLKGVSEPFLLVVEAPMGEGKTEASFIADAHAAANLHLRGMYFAMPTQATSNALFGRLAAYLERKSAGQLQTIQLVHGGANLMDTQLRLHDIGFGSADSSVQTSIWFGGARKGLLAPNAVGTIDQALVGVLNAKHAFVRLFGLSDRLVVLDEVHAYDDYTGSLLERLVAWLAGLGCSVVVMSATLPLAKRQGLLQAFGVHQDAPDVAYPRALLVSQGEIRACTFEPARYQSVQVIEAPEQTDHIAALALSMKQKDSCVLVVANTVDRSQAIYSCLREIGATDVVLFHARFPMQKRLKIEKQILDRFGPQGSGRGGAIVVATQVVEQSLDVDFDVLISDLAPIDLLLQRVGRLHRHERPRSAVHLTPVFYIAGLGNEGIPPKAPRAVYDAWPTLRTAALLRKESMLQLPQDIDRLVQAVYENKDLGDIGDLEEAINVASLDYCRRVEKQRNLAMQSALREPDDWTSIPMSVPVNDEDAIVASRAGGTRLGEDSITVIPVFDFGSCWSVTCDKDVTWDKSEIISDSVARNLAEQCIRISNKAAIHLAKNGTTPNGWGAKRDLAWTYPLVLNSSGVIQDQYISIRLDPNLGLVYVRKSKEGGSL